MKLRIQGLWPKKSSRKDENEKSEAFLDVDPGTNLADLIARLKDHDEPDGLLRKMPNETKNLRIKQEIEAPNRHRLIEVVDGSSDFFEGKINVHDTFKSFRDLEFPKEPVSAKLSSSGTAASKTLVVDGNLEIRFHRTIRLPDDNKLHPLPSSCGTFPLYNVNAFSRILPRDVVSKGGVFFPMWQREALWIEFEAFEHLDSRGPTEYALRVNLGEVNAITGLLIREVSDTQDYVVVPGQDWIDGILVEPGVVRQFVAMPLGSGYTVEGQVTKEEKIGGLQIEITPRVPDKVYNDARFSVPDLPSLNIHETCHSKEISIGTRIVMEWDHRPRKPKVADLVNEIQDQTNDDEINLSAWYDEAISFNDKRVILDDFDFDPYFRLNDAGYDMVSSPAPPSAALPQSAQFKISSPSIEASENPRDSSFDTSEPIQATRDIVQQMGIAAGGKLIQDIQKDFGSRSDWHKERTRLVNVQIFDSATFEAATHIVPPPTPVTAKSYADAGQPFWLVDEEPDGRLEPSQTLATVQSVSNMDREAGVTEDHGEDIDPLKPRKCQTCSTRLCDCVIRPCNHQFCSVCVAAVEQLKRCPTCDGRFTRVAGFAAPMNLPGENTYKVNVPVVMLEVKDGRSQFRSVEEMRL